MPRSCPRCDFATTSSASPTPASPTSASGSDKQPGGRNLVVCIDGTANQFGLKNTNVIELYSELVNDEEQLTYYNSGIGTYARRGRPGVPVLLAVTQTLDMMVAKTIPEIVQRAYRWLAENYQRHDHIFLFGFSRGAYAVRMLAAMIYKVGLIRKGNEEQIPFAYSVYEDPATDKAPELDQGLNKISGIFKDKRMDKNMSLLELRLADQHAKEPKKTMAQLFKETFSRNVPVHFVGVWDTVSAVGLVRRNPHPGTNNPYTACYFRHALALDERRVKFLPEYACGGKGLHPETTSNEAELDGTGLNGEPELPDERVKEVWFSGTHSDIGGGNVPNLSLDNGPAPLVWMSSEAYAAGLKLHFTKFGRWNTVGRVHESLKSFWRFLEYLPVKRLSYTEKDSLTRRLHLGQGRPLQLGQRVHISVALFRRDQLPRATLPQSKGLRWAELVDKSPLQNEWENIIEIDALAAKVLVSKIVQRGDDLDRCLQLLAAMTSLNTGLELLRNDPPAVLSLHLNALRAGEGQIIVQQALHRIGKVNASVLDARPDLMLEMGTLISQWITIRHGFEVVLNFLHNHNLMRRCPSFVGVICNEMLLCLPETLGTPLFKPETRCVSVRVLAMAARDGNASLRSRIAEKIGSIVLDLLKDSATWGKDRFDVIHELLEELASHAESCVIAFGDIPSLLRMLKELAVSENEALCEHIVRILGALSASKEGRRLVMDEGERVFVNSDLLTYLLDVLARGASTEVAFRCFSLFQTWITFGDTRPYITDTQFLSTVFYTVAARDDPNIRKRLLAFLREVVHYDDIHSHLLQDVVLPLLYKAKLFSTWCSVILLVSESWRENHRRNVKNQWREAAAIKWLQDGASDDHFTIDVDTVPADRTFVLDINEALGAYTATRVNAAIPGWYEADHSEAETMSTYSVMSSVGQERNARSEYGSMASSTKEFRLKSAHAQDRPLSDENGNPLDSGYDTGGRAQRGSWYDNLKFARVFPQMWTQGDAF